MLAIALSEKRGGGVVNLIRANPGNCYIHAANAVEVAYKLLVRGVEETTAWDAVVFGGVFVVDDIPDRMSRRAALLKKDNEHLSLGDCLCLAFAEEMGGSLLATDKQLVGCV